MTLKDSHCWQSSCGVECYRGYCFAVLGTMSDRHIMVTSSSCRFNDVHITIFCSAKLQDIILEYVRHGTSRLWWEEQYIFTAVKK